MNTKLFSLILLFALLLAACSPAISTSEQLRSQGSSQEQQQSHPRATQAPAQPREVEKEVVVVQEPRAEPTQVVAATREPMEPGVVPTPADNYFQDYGVNPYVDTYEDHLSTFAIDVDTAAYSVMRNYVTDGNLPPADAVRVEEYVNYFDQGYPTPADVAFGIYADGAPSPFSDDGTYILRIGIQGYRVPEYQRKPASLIFVIDTSGSMDQENRLELVKQSLEYLVDQMYEGDTVGIVAYSTEARVVLYPTDSRHRSDILNAIYSLYPEDTTNAEAGLNLGYQLATEYYRPDTINRVILCSDGVANVGATGPDAIMERVRRYVDEGIQLTSIGVGMGNFNDVLLEQLADNGDGNYYYVDTVDEARKLFTEDLVSTLQVIALDAKVQVDFNPDVVSRYRLIGYENRAVSDQDFRNNQVDAGEIGAGHSSTALYAVQFKSGADGRIGTVQLRWQDPDTREVHEINGNFNTWDMANSFDEASPRYQLAVVVAQYAEMLRDSPWAGEVSMYRLSEYAEQVRRLLPEDADVAEFASLIARASDIRR